MLKVETWALFNGKMLRYDVIRYGTRGAPLPASYLKLPRNILLFILTL